MNLTAIQGIVSQLLVLIVITASFMLTSSSIPMLFTMYSLQSLLLAILAFSRYFSEFNGDLIIIGALTLVTKTILIPLFMRGIHGSMKVHRDAEFKYLSPTTSLAISMFLILLVYSAFSGFSGEWMMDSVSAFGAVLGISLAFIGMLVIFSRKEAITKILGYLTMENGVLLFSLFFSGLPMIIEILIMLDLMILILLVTILAFGMDSTIEQFHEKLNPMRYVREEDEE
jgi:hydrogenase-4 component E